MKLVSAMAVAAVAMGASMVGVANVLTLIVLELEEVNVPSVARTL